MFKELWSQYTAWEESHLIRLFEKLVAEKWKEGLLELLKSYTTELLFSAQTCEK